LINYISNLSKLNYILLITRLNLWYIIKLYLNLISVANNKSAKKRIQVSERNRLVNKSYKSTVRTLTKKTFANCEKYKQEPNSDNKELVLFSVNEAFSLIDKAVKKNVLHKNNGANKKSRINKVVKDFLTSK